MLGTGVGDERVVPVADYGGGTSDFTVMRVGPRRFQPSDVLAHATPDVLANHLPPELLSKVLQASLASGSMTADRVLETVTPELLAKHLPHDVLWACIAAAAARAGVSTS